MRKLLLVIFLLFFQTLQSFTPDLQSEERKQTIILPIERVVIPTPNKITTILYTNDNLFNSVIDTIKKHEGLRLTSYMCPANQKTIGYGHCITPTDKIKDTITIDQAEYLLREDFNKALSFVKEKVKGTSIENKHHKVLALAHLTYNIGIGSFEKSSILTKIKNNEFVAEDLLKWIYYKNKDNKLVASKHLKKMRQYEVDLFNGVS